MLIKPCARADRGCTGMLKAKRHASTTHCSYRCAVKTRMEAGWRPESGLTKATRSRGGALGGRIAGIRRKRDAMQRAVQPMEKFLTPEFRDGLSPDQLARVRVLISRAYQIGYKRGYQTGNAHKRYWAAKEKAA